MLKTCHKCGKEKSVECFDRSSFTKDGFYSKCKLCESDRQALKYKNNRDKISRKNQEWKDANRDKISSFNKLHYACNKIKYDARTALNLAISRGDVVKDNVCADCGGKSEHAHHEDYSKTLEVVWLCRSCHKRRHALLKEEMLQKN